MNVPVYEKKILNLVLFREFPMLHREKSIRFNTYQYFFPYGMIITNKLIKLIWKIKILAIYSNHIVHQPTTLINFVKFQNGWRLSRWWLNELGGKKKTRRRHTGFDLRGITVKLLLFVAYLPKLAAEPNK